jgi:hypothetical protein
MVAAAPSTLTSDAVPIHAAMDSSPMTILRFPASDLSRDWPSDCGRRLSIPAFGAGGGEAFSP